MVRTRKRHPNRSLTEAQIKSLLTATDNIQDDALIRLGLSVGLRVSEVVSIRTSEIDFERGIIKIWDEKKDRWRTSHIRAISILVDDNLDTVGELPFGL